MSAITIIKRILKAVAGVTALFVLANILGALPLPTGTSNAAGPETVRIYVLSNGFHSDIALPDRDGETLHDFGLDERDYPVDPQAVRYWAFGWGSVTAYTSLLKVSDLTPSIIARALAFDSTVMHIQPLGVLQHDPQNGVFAIDITTTQYGNLLASISRSFEGSPQLYGDVTQGFGDRFYRGTGRFSPLISCNVWTARRLRDAAIPVGVWTPFAQGLEFGLHRVASKS